MKRFIQILTLAVSTALVACNSSTTTGSVGGDTTTTVASYAGSYSGTTTGVNGGPTTMVISADNKIKGTFTINNRTNDAGVPTIYDATFDNGSVDSNGKILVNSYLEGALVMIFSGQISSTGALSGTYYEAAHPGDPAKSGTFSLQGPKSGTTTTTSGGSAKSCTGSYVGNYGPPDHDERIAARNRSLAGRGIAVTGNDSVDNGNAGGGDPDGGIWMAGSFAFETDANCNVVKGTDMIFFVYQYDITGTMAKSGTSKLVWQGQGSIGEMEVSVDSNNVIAGSHFHPAPDTYVRGVLSGTFTPNGKI